MFLRYRRRRRLFRSKNELKYHEMSFSSSECVTWLTVTLVESVAIVTLNVATVIIFIKKRNLRKRSLYLVMNLAFADMLVGGITGVMFFVITGVQCNIWTYRLPPHGIWNIILTFIQLLVSVTSIINLAAISLERMHATFRPFKHRVMTKCVFGAMIVVIWVTAALSSLTLVLIQNLYPEKYSKHYLYVYNSLNCVCVFVIIVAYASIVVNIYCGAHPQRHGAANRYREKKLTKTLFIVTLVSLLASLPIVILNFITFATDGIHFFSRSTYNALIVLYYANSLVNPILYAIRIPEFKRAMLSLFRCRSQQRHFDLPLHVF